MNTQIAARSFRAIRPFVCRTARATAPLTVVALGLSLSTLAVIAGAQSTPRYLNVNGFSIQPPAGFARNTQKAPAGAAMYMAPEQNNFSANIMIRGGAVEQNTFAELVAGANKDIRSDKEATFVSQRDILTGPGAPIHIIRVRRKAMGMSVDQYNVVGVKNHRGYIITMSALTSSMKQYAPRFDKAVSSLRWEK